MQFLVCSSCARHVKIEEHACPFCGVSTEDANTHDLTKRRNFQGIRDRQALLFGAAIATAVAATALATTSCGPAAPVAMYGGPPVQDVHDVNGGATPARGNDASAPTATPPVDAGAAAATAPTAVPLYGMAPSH